MSTGAQASATTIARLACRLAIPGDAATRGELYWRLEHVLQTRLPDALAAALAELDDGDPEEVWVVRSMRADVIVSAELEDLDRLAAQWGRQLAQAIIARLRAGPGGDVVRFSSRAEHLAEFVAALAGGRAGGWMFEPFAGLRLLPPLAALRNGAAGAGIAVSDVVGQLIAIGRLEAVLARASEAEMAGLWAACVEETRTTTLASRELVNRLRVIAAERLPAQLLTASAPALALRLVAAANEQHGSGSDVFAAAAVLVGGTSGTGFAPGLLGADPGAPAAVGAHAVPAVGDPVAGRPESGSRGRVARDGSRVFAAAGAPAFMLLRSLEQIGLAGGAADARASALAQAMRCDTDGAVTLAAGAEGREPGARFDGAQLLRGLRLALEADDRVDGRWLLAERLDHPDGSGHIGLIRDITSDLWLAGAVRARAREIPWATLIEDVEADVGRAPLLVLGERQTAAWTHTQQSSAALAKLAPASIDLAWLSCGNDDRLAAALAGRAALHDLARRLLSFEHSSMAYLVERFLPLGGIVTVTEQRIQAELGPAQLAVILVMAGLDHFSYTVPWLAQEVSVVHRGD